jgi:acyl-CoA reductase-like NAD-dependent aldehyde dehydrogenase
MRAANESSIGLCIGILYNTGQDCTAGSRVYVQDTVYDEFVSLLVSKAKQLVVGYGFDQNSSAGPVVGVTSRGHGYTSQAVTKGFKVTIRQGLGIHRKRQKGGSHSYPRRRKAAG